MSTMRSYEYYEKIERVQQWNLFICQTASFYFSTYCPNLFVNTYWHSPVRPYERCDFCDRWISRWNNTSVRSFLVHKQFSHQTVQTCIGGLVKHLSPYTERISQSEWYLDKVLLPRENEKQNAIPYGMLSAVASPYLSLTNDVTLTSS